MGLNTTVNYPCQLTLMKTFFSLCTKFISLLPVLTLENRQRQRSCYLLSIAASLQSVEGKLTDEHSEWVRGLGGPSVGLGQHL